MEDTKMQTQEKSARPAETRRVVQPIARAEQSPDSKETTRLFIELPGVDPSDVEVSMEEQTLTVRGKTTSPETADFPDVRLSEFATSVDYERSFRISTEVDVDAIEADYKNGVLELRLPQRQPQQRSISVNSLKS